LCQYHCRRVCIHPPLHGAQYIKIKLHRYRRGKPESNDIDIVFTHPNAKSAKDLGGRLVERLRSAGLVTHVMREQSPRLFVPPNARMLMLSQTSPDSSSTMRCALLSVTQSKPHSRCTEHPAMVGTAAST
jgi:hypothetical protein